MKDIYEVLRQKEEDSVRLKSEIDALKLVIPLLVDQQPKPPKQVEAVEEVPSHASRSTGTDGPTFSSLGRDSSFWKRNR